jgi:hypothetical protein
MLIFSNILYVIIKIQYKIQLEKINNKKIFFRIKKKLKHKQTILLYIY